MFFNRQSELQRLHERYAGKEAQLLIMYGRRRVGKTELLKEFVRDKPHIYFLADLSSEKEQLQEFTERIRLFSQDPSLVENPFANWRALFAYVRKLAQNAPLVVIIDEYQYLQSSNRAMASIIQKAWDEELKNSRLFLVLCGSYVSFIEQELLAYKSPLYGRRTGQFYVEPLTFYQARDFFAGFSMEDKVRAFGILGGMPAYLLQFDDRKTIAQNIKATLLQTDAFLNNEARFLLMEELKEPRNYFSILKAVAAGNTRLNEIVQASGLDRGTVVKYLDVLQNLRIIRRELPVTELQPEKSRKGIYVIQDQYLRFWFRFIMPNQSYIEENRQDFLLQQRILPFLDQYLGEVFENVCIEFLKQRSRLSKLPFPIDRIGRHWKGETEIDIVAFDANREQALVAECKWSTKKVGTNILDDLIVKSSLLQRENGFKKIYYALLSKAGYTDGLRQTNRPDLFLFDLRDLEHEKA
ncbi:MAG: ATP-binding protein [candidate division KSB1 bacterium]|nr:ATP-binding protein [candidate division KSB1 bacterium]MDZ7305340.1 ATP-binding protein [candidate division KSB1 bacterium]MDZ7312031.1 ATP-binding protein [candidate division KSB1 bacterium]